MKQYWNQFCKEQGINEDTVHPAWQFDGAPDNTADLVLDGMKTTIWCLYDWYKEDKEPLPKEEDCSIISSARTNLSVSFIQTMLILFHSPKQLQNTHIKKVKEKGDTNIGGGSILNFSRVN